MCQVEILQALPWCPQKAPTLEAQRRKVALRNLFPSRFFVAGPSVGGFRSHTLPLGRRRRLL
jgi:hypothetical protein